MDDVQVVMVVREGVDDFLRVECGGVQSADVFNAFDGGTKRMAQGLRCDGELVALYAKQAVRAAHVGPRRVKNGVADDLIRSGAVVQWLERVYVEQGIEGMVRDVEQRACVVQ